MNLRVRFVRFIGASVIVRLPKREEHAEECKVRSGDRRNAEGPGWTRRKSFPVAKIAMVVSPLDTERI